MACVASNVAAFFTSPLSKSFVVNRVSSSSSWATKKKSNLKFLWSSGGDSDCNGDSCLPKSSSPFKCFAQVSEQSGFAVGGGGDDNYGFSDERLVALVIGGGGREHALCYALKRSPSCDAVFCAPGNTGISNSGDATCIMDLDVCSSSAVISFCRMWGVGLVVVGPEVLLVAGLANDLVKVGIPTFGPSAEAAALEGSKDFMKKLCYKYGIPTAKVGDF